PGGQEARRIFQIAVLVDLEVQVAARHLDAGAADGADDVARVDDLPRLDAERVEVEVAAAHAALVHDAHEEAARAHHAGPAAPAFELPRQQAEGRVIALHVDARELHDAVGDRAHRLANGGVDVDAAVRALAAVAVDAQAAGAQAGRALEGRRDGELQ